MNGNITCYWVYEWILEPYWGVDDISEMETGKTKLSSMKKFFPTTKFC